MKLIQYLDNVIANNLLEEQEQSERKRELHGRLSGSILGAPLQEQVLHILNIPQKELDSYVLRKFIRGHHVEAWAMTQIPGVVDDQAELTYRGASGHIDALVDMSKWEDKELQDLGVIPHEIKSITNAAFKYLNKTKTAKWGHKLQAGMYALATNSDHYMIHYIASDDYRIFSMLYETKEIAADIDQIISEVADTLKSGIVPVFEARETWQDNPLYQKYPTWVGLTQEECMAKLEKEYPTAYQRLQSFVEKS